MKRFNVLCGCGWGRLACPESEILYECPVCSQRLRQGLDDSDEELDFRAVGYHSGNFDPCDVNLAKVMTQRPVK